MVDDISQIERLFIAEYIEISVKRLSSTPAECTAAKSGCVYGVDVFSGQEGYSIAMEEFNRGDLWVSIMGTDALTDITAPGGATAFDKCCLFFCELALFLRNMGKAGCARYNGTSRAGGKTSATGEALSPTDRRDCTEQLRGDVGDNLADEDVGAVFIIDEQAIFSLDTESRLNGGVNLVNRAVVTVSLRGGAGEGAVEIFDDPFIHIADENVVIKRGCVGRDILALPYVVGD